MPLFPGYLFSSGAAGMLSFKVFISLLTLSAVLIASINGDSVSKESVTVVSFSWLLLQAVRTAATVKMANSFFIFLFLKFKTGFKFPSYRHCSWQLFPPEKKPYRHTTEIKFTTQLVFEVIFIRRFYIIGIVTEKCKTGCKSRQLGYIDAIWNITDDIRGTAGEVAGTTALREERCGAGRGISPRRLDGQLNQSKVWEGSNRTTFKRQDLS
jgi:hypothetical protein